jgi:hypothetical protein
MLKQINKHDNGFMTDDCSIASIVYTYIRLMDIYMVHQDHDSGLLSSMKSTHLLGMLHCTLRP